MNLMSLFSPIEKLINEHGSAAIQATHINLLREQLSIIRDAFSKLDTQNEILKSNFTELKKNNAGLQEKYTQLKNEIDNWNNKIEDYSLIDAGSGVSVYAKTKNANPAEPRHWICANCVGNRKYSILQNEGTHLINHRIKYFCPNCKTTFLTTKNPC